MRSIATQAEREQADVPPAFLHPRAEKGNVLGVSDRLDEVRAAGRLAVGRTRLECRDPGINPDYRGQAEKLRRRYAQK